MAGAGRATCRIIGPLEKDMKVEETQNGFRIGTILIRCDNGYSTSEGNWVPKIQYVPVKLFSRQLDKCVDENVGIADLVDVTGKVGGREYKGKYYTEIVADDIMLLDRGTGKGTSTATFPKVDMVVMPDMTKPIPKQDEDDDLPF